MPDDHQPDRDVPIDDDELDERLEIDAGEPLPDVPTEEPAAGGTHDDLGRGAD